MKIDINNLSYPCLIGTIHSAVKIQNLKELKYFVRDLLPNNKAIIKNGFNENMQVKFIFLNSGHIIEFLPQEEERPWARYFSFMVDLSKLNCKTVINNNLSKTDIANIFKSNITSLDRHFPTTMKVYKFLKKEPINSKFTTEELKIFWCTI